MTGRNHWKSAPCQLQEELKYVMRRKSPALGPIREPEFKVYTIASLNPHGLQSSVTSSVWELGPVEMCFGRLLCSHG